VAAGIATALLAIALPGVAIGGAEGASPQVSCGDHIKADTVLHNDLVDCPDNGILIGADNVTLDLNGHTIDGNGKPNKSCEPNHFCDTGVAFGHRDGVTVKHGSIRQFEAGIVVYRSSHARLLGVSTSRNHFSGIAVAGSAHILVRNSSGNGTTDREGEGLGLFQSRHIRVLRSSFKRNAHAGIKPVHSSDALIEGNLVSGSGDEGFLMEGGADFTLKNNRLVRNGAGITLGPGNGNVVSRNRIFGGRDGIRVEKGRRNLVTGNLVVRTRRAGIRLGIPHPLLGGARNVVRRNRVTDSRGDGFRVGRKDRQSVLKRNVAKGARDDGFDVASRSATLTRNRAVDNQDFGIDAVAGVSDGGGNVASGNGHVPQCLNIACR
jgi:parallel beta-helix repeat protein